MYIVLLVLLSICLLIGSLFFLERSKNRLLWKALGNTLEENVRLTFELAEWKRKVGQNHIHTVYSGANKEVFFCGLEGQARKDRYKQLVKLLHPDNGGDKQLFQKMMEEYEG
ncbi:hypothetical protein [Anaerotignum lactatifermentans]|uniref:hypothetical protein n=1 Tax=Anaerotignum lactatifermentans TaxID=160404 RepID=UPI0026744CD7|nr:hypothetical protein [Anaerotignum lactatifermentans]